MLSIIIPAKNEEVYLAKLLNSIKKQDYKDYEVIVADAGSKDKTRKIAKKYGCRVVKGGFPSVGRNNGARDAKGDYFLFLDADTILPDKHFLSKFLNEFSKRGLDIATCKLSPDSESWSDKFVMGSINLLTRLVKNFWPHTHGGCTLCKREVHKKIKGFDESIVLAEDSDYARRAAKFFKLGIIKDINIVYSIRRFHKEGIIKMILRYTFLHITRLFLGKVKGDKFDYFQKN